MMKKLLSILLTAALALCAALPLVACEETPALDLPACGHSENGLLFLLNEDRKSYTVSKGNFEGTDLVIPETFNGAPVTEIEDSAFYDCTDMQSVTIGKRVTHIGGLAFSCCTDLKEITIPDSVTFIGYEAFEETAYIADETNYDADGNLYIGKHLIDVKDTIEGSYTVKSGTKTIAGGAFEDCGSLQEITLPKGITSFGDCALRFCESLQKITIPNSVTHLGSYAFYGCSNLKELAIPNSVTFIGDYVFIGCSSLKELKIPDSVTHIGYASVIVDINDLGEDGGLYTGKHLVAVINTAEGNYIVKPDTKTIADGAFEGCRNLQGITIPRSLTHIGGGAFYRGNYLQNINVEEGNPNYCSVGGALYNKAKTELVLAPGAVQSFSILSSVTYIGEYALAYCYGYGLQEVTIPDSVTYIGDRAFYNCNSLQHVTIGSGVTYIGDYAFCLCGSLHELTIPSSVAYIGKGAFSSDGGRSLSIKFEGTTDEWKAIEKGYGWGGNIKEVICTNGTLTGEDMD